MKLISGLLTSILLAACALGGPGSFISPLAIPDQIPVMLENQWRLTEVVYKDEHLSFDTIDPVLVTFSLGEMVVRSCNGSGFLFETIPHTLNEYRLIRGNSTLIYCPGGGTEQENGIHWALLATDRYDIDGDILILSGENARLTFVIDNEAKKSEYVIPTPTPAQPLSPLSHITQVPILVENQWRLTEAIHNDTRLNLDLIAPVLLWVNEDGMVVFGCIGISIPMYTVKEALEDPNEYRLSRGVQTEQNCFGEGTEQERSLRQALSVTHRYDLDGGILILSGENTRLTFVIDNEAQKTQ